jgi:hypothetical protein
VCLALVERQRDEGPVAEYGDRQGDDQRAPEVGEVGRTHGEDVAEEEAPDDDTPALDESA